MGMGLANAYGAAGGSDELLQILARRQMEQDKAFQQKRQLGADSRDDRRLNIEEADQKERRTIAQQNAASLADSRFSEAEKRAADKKALEDKHAEELSKRQAAMDFINDPKSDPKLVQSVRYKMMTGEALPAGWFAAPRAAPRDPVADRLASHAGTLAQDNANKDELSRRDDPKLPSGVKAYVVQLQGKYSQEGTGPRDPKTGAHPGAGGYGEALAELNRAMPNLLLQHKDLDPSRATQLLRQQFAQPTGRQPVSFNVGANDTQ